MTRKYAIGVDYGTQSGRAVLVNLANGLEIADHVTPYRHHVIDRNLPDSGVPLEPDWALQHPADYIEVLTNSVPAVIEAAEVKPADIIALGIDFTACTMLPVDAAGEPLCFKSEFKEEPHSWVKLWKHHAAQLEADLINNLARERNEAWLPRYGGKISSEWMMAKVWQILREAPNVFHSTDRFMEATDWVVFQLTGQFTRNSCAAGYACGGLPQKNQLLMQIYADVTNLEIHIAESKQTPALGAATFAAVAAGSANGGYDSIQEAVPHMARVQEQTIKPIAENVATYSKLYKEYEKLHDYFGRGQNEVMKRLKDLKISSRS